MQKGCNVKPHLPLIALVLSVALYPAEVPAKARTASPEEARKIVLDYATCVVKRSHNKAAEALLANADTRTIKRDFRRLINSDCVGSGVSIDFDADFFRYALADALVSSEFALAGPTDFSDRPLLTHLQPPTQTDLDHALAKVRSAKERDELQRIFRAAQVVPSLSSYGECVVRSDPNDARLWVLSKPGTPEEATRIDALRHSFGACLKDGKITFSRETLRGTVALNYYRLAHAPAQPSAAKAE